MEGCGRSPIWSGQRVERTNARGRHTYVPAFRHWIVEQAMQPGVSLAGLAMTKQANANLPTSCVAGSSCTAIIAPTRAWRRRCCR